MTQAHSERARANEKRQRDLAQADAFNELLDARDALARASRKLTDAEQPDMAAEADELRDQAVRLLRQARVIDRKRGEESR